MGSVTKTRARAEKWRVKKERDAVVALDSRAVRDPLRRPARRTWLLGILGCVVASVLLHGAAVAAAALLPSPRERPRPEEPLRITVLSAPEKTPPPPPPPEPTTPPPEPLPARILPRLPVESRPVPNAPPPDPTEPPVVVADPVPTATARRRVVGVSLDSTTAAGAGAAYAPGNTRMGQTAGVADDPKNMGGQVGRSFTPPRRRTEPPPQYPPSLRERGVEGEVGIEAAIDASGAVTRVSVVRPSAYPEFDRAAAAAASKGTYDAARLDGVAVANVITFTVRFRLHP